MIFDIENGALDGVPEQRLCGRASEADLCNRKKTLRPSHVVFARKAGK